MEKVEKNDKKRTSEKPVSLHPIPFEEAVRDLLNIKPLPKEPVNPEKRKNPRR